MKIRSRAPLRLGIGGGGTDVSPYCDTFGGVVLNATIDRYAWTTLDLLEEPSNHVIFESADLGLIQDFSFSDIFEKPLTSPLLLHKVVYKYFIDNFNSGKPIALKVTTLCEVPMGSGLGASSTIVVSLIKAFDELFHTTLDDYEIANLAVFIERELCQLKGGRQDQFAASFGGVNFIEFGKKTEALVNSLRIKRWVINELEASLLLFFTGVSRDSATIISNQSENLHKENTDAVEAMHRIKSNTYALKRALLEGDFEKFCCLINENWKNKVKTSSKVSNNRIDSILSTAFKFGAKAGKVSGAGGGGFMWFFVPPEKKHTVITELQKFEGMISECHFVENGAESWKIK